MVCMDERKQACEGTVHAHCACARWTQGILFPTYLEREELRRQVQRQSGRHVHQRGAQHAKDAQHHGHSGGVAGGAVLHHLAEGVVLRVHGVADPGGQHARPHLR